jgi:hypothetical protein
MKRGRVKPLTVFFMAMQYESRTVVGNFSATLDCCGALTVRKAEQAGQHSTLPECHSFPSNNSQTGIIPGAQSVTTARELADWRGRVYASPRERPLAGGFIVADAPQHQIEAQCLV